MRTFETYDAVNIPKTELKPYVYKNLALLMAGDWFLDKGLAKLIVDAIPAVERFEAREGFEDPAETELSKIITEPLKEVYTMPFFSKEFCNMLIDEIDNMEKTIGFAPNEEEMPQHQINEFVLQEHAQDLYISFMKIVLSKMNVVFETIWNRQVVAGGIQLANYNPRGIKQTAWHHDSLSDISVVVPLNTGDYTGGGTEFHKRGKIAPLPTGNTLIFPSFTHLHRGLPVEKGDRYLLVFWLQFEERDESFYDKLK